MEPLFMVNGLFPAFWAGQAGFSIELIQADFAYVLDAKGWKLFKRNGVSTALIPIDCVSGLSSLETLIDFTATRIPLDLVRQVTAWFKAVYTKHASEAVGYLYYQPQSGEWQFMPPTQTATSASAKYDEAPKIAGWKVVGTIHSHGSMSAFHSGVDDTDEKFFDGIHITVGRVDTVPEYSCSLVIQGKREKVDPSIVIDGMAPIDTVPTAWLSAMKEPAPKGLEARFQSKADALYQRYYVGEISEKSYQDELATIELDHKTFCAAKAKRKGNIKTIPAFGEFDYEKDFARMEPKSSRKTFSASGSKKKDKILRR